VSDESEQRLLALTAAKPWDADAMLKLGLLQVAALKYDEAAQTLRRAIVLTPDDPRPWLIYAEVLIHLHEGEESTDKAFHRAAKVCGSHPAILGRVIDYFVKDEKPHIALHYLNELLSAHPAASPATQLQYVSALRATGNSREAESTCRTLMAGLKNAAAVLEGSRQERLLVRQAMLLQAAGLDDEIEACLQDCARRMAPFEVRFDLQETVLPDSAAKIAAYQSQLRGKDVFVFLPGPSAAAFAENARRFADWDFVAATMAGYTDTIESTMLKPIGRAADLLFLSNPAQLRAGEESILRLLQRGTGIRLLSQAYAFAGHPRAADLIERLDPGMLWMEGGDCPPTPSRPLEFLPGNSLSVFLPLLFWGEPKRIVLFGADGGAATSDLGRPYYFAPDAPAEGEGERTALMKRLEKMPVNRRSFASARRRFQLEAHEADNIVTLTAQVLRVVFGLKTPEIVNCCPHSTHRAFKRVGVGEFLTHAGRPSLV
jgi:hypothetical protein